ncbi:MAG: hypothetical protein KF861_12355 [Planctomycetaceae bacterium]|nr:hypothetical protein [Planctomycetaceae bacterium]
MPAAWHIPELQGLRRCRRCLQWALLMLALAGAAAASGCQSSGTSAWTMGPSAWLGKSKSSLDQSESIDGIMGPTERKLKQASWEQKQREAAANGERIEGLAEYQAAMRLYDAGRYSEAERAFKKLAKERRYGGLNFAERAAHALQTGVSYPSANGFGDPVEEDALFMTAEAQFMQQKYSWAQDSYDRLLERYPSTRHMDQVTRQMFRIAQAWMNFPDANQNDNVELASSELQETNPRTGNRSFKRPSFFNVTDRSRPVFDTAGRALQALQSIWLNDASGPLADDALMLTANYHLQTGNFIEAARVYQLLRDQYPDSPHFKDAYLLDSHVRLASYEGPAYDSLSLKQSRELRETAQRLFPDLTPEQRERLERELARIQISEVEREWHKVEFYQSKGQVESIELHCNIILNRFPDSPYAERARETLADIADQKRRSASPVVNFLSSGQSYQRPATGRTQTASRPTSASEGKKDNGAAGSATTRKPGMMERMLTPVRQTPKLQPVGPAGSSGAGSPSP